MRAFAELSSQCEGASLTDRSLRLSVPPSRLLMCLNCSLGYRLSLPRKKAVAKILLFVRLVVHHIFKVLSPELLPAEERLSRVTLDLAEDLRRTLWCYLPLLTDMQQQSHTLKQLRA